MTKLSVIVCTYNRSNLLRKCLESLVSQDCKNFEILVIDNNSSDDTRKVAESFEPSVKYYFESKVGLSHARNTGYKNAAGEYIAYIDDDAYAPSNWCELIIKNIDEYQFDACGGKIIPYYEEKRPWWFDDRLEIRNYGKQGFVPKNRIRFGFPGSNIIIKKEHIYNYGGFDPELGMKGGKIGLGEETSLCLKISEHHVNFFHDPDLFVYHYTPKKITTLSYRVKRNYAAGASALKMQGGNPIQLLKKSLALTAFVLFLPVSAFILNRYLFVYSIQQIAYKIGFINALIKSYTVKDK
jgi:glucosyl-dolichyl phosphate glucuronosyltransferase